MFSPFAEPPTKNTIQDARRSLRETRDSAQDLSNKIDAAEHTLAQVIADSRRKIEELKSQRDELTKKEELTLAYLAPIRTLPLELLRDIFLRLFEEDPCCAWTMAAVCTSWRNLSLQTPKLWSKIRLLTTTHDSPDIIRLWLERSGLKEPLDIDICLESGEKSGHSPEGNTRYGRRSSSVSFGPWGAMIPPAVHSHYIQPTLHGPQTITILPPGGGPIPIPPIAPAHSDSAHSSSSTSERAQSCSMAWGHVVFYYLVEHIHRWRRFHFVFEKHFHSLSALSTISGDAPLLEELEIACLDPVVFTEWSPMPTIPLTTSGCVQPRLKSLALQSVPFKFTSPMFQSLHTLDLRPVGNTNYSLSQITKMITRNLSLKELTLRLHSISQTVLQLNPIVLPDIEKLNIGGHYMVLELLDMLTVPNLKEFTLEVEPHRHLVDDTVINLLNRSGKPQVESLSLSSTSVSGPFYYNSGGLVGSWAALLAEFSSLKTLRVAACQLESLFTALGVPDDEISPTSSWVVPCLESMSLRNCQVQHTSGVQRLVQAVKARNPNPNAGPAMSVNGVTPVRLKTLDLCECTNVGEEVVQWLGERVDEVVFTPGDEDEVPRSPYMG